MPIQLPIASENDDLPLSLYCRRMGMMEMREQQVWLTWDILFFWEEWFCLVSFFCMFPRKDRQTEFELLLLLLIIVALCPRSYATRWREWGSGIAWVQAARRARRWSWWWGWGAVVRQSSQRYYWDCVTSHSPGLHEWTSTGQRVKVSGNMEGISKLASYGQKHVDVYRTCHWTETQSFMTKQNEKEWSDTFIYVMLPQHCKI